MGMFSKRSWVDGGNDVVVGDQVTAIAVATYHDVSADPADDRAEWVDRGGAVLVGGAECSSARDPGRSAAGAGPAVEDRLSGAA